MGLSASKEPDDLNDIDDGHTPADVLANLVGVSSRTHKSIDSRAPRKRGKGYKKAAQTMSNLQFGETPGDEQVGLSNFRWGQSGDLRPPSGDLRFPANRAPGSGTTPAPST